MGSLAVYGEEEVTRDRLETCPECGRQVDRRVNGARCPSCGERVFDGSETADQLQCPGCGSDFDPTEITRQYCGSCGYDITQADTPK